MMCAVPFFTISIYKDDNNSFEFGLELIKAYDEINSTRGF